MFGLLALCPVSSRVVDIVQLTALYLDFKFVNYQIANGDELVISLVGSPPGNRLLHIVVD